METQLARKSCRRCTEYDPSQVVNPEERRARCRGSEGREGLREEEGIILGRRERKEYILGVEKKEGTFEAEREM